MAGTKLPAAPSAAERQSALKPGCRRARLAADRQRTQRKHTSTKTAERITLRKLKVDFLILTLMGPSPSGKAEGPRVDWLRPPRNISIPRLHVYVGSDMNQHPYRRSFACRPKVRFIRRQ